MKQLENIVTIEGGHTATLVKRNDKAAIYKRETAEGQFVSFEVFALRSKNGMEIYPNQTAVKNRWCMCPTSETKANTWFDRFTNGDIVIPNVDPVTGEPLEAADNRSLDELPDVNVSVDAPSIPSPVVSEPVAIVEDTLPKVDVEVTVDSVPSDVTPTDIAPTVEVPTVEEDPSAPAVAVPTVEVPEVTPTADGGVAVTVAKVKKNVVTFNIPTGEFTQADFANANGLPERGVVWSKLDGLVKEGKLTKRFGTTGKGRPKAFFTATATV
jgi:hypothetical protein